MSEFKIIECPRDAWQGLPRLVPTEEKVDYLRALIGAGFRHLDTASFVSPKKVPQMADSEAVLEALATGRPDRRKKPRGGGPSGSRRAGTAPGRGGAPGRSASARRAAAAAAAAADDQTVTDDPFATLRGAPREVSLEGVEIIGIVLNEKGLERALAAPAVTTIGYPYSLSPTFQKRNANISVKSARAMVETMASGAKESGRSLVVYLSMAFGNPYGDAHSPAALAEEIDRLREMGVPAVSLADTAAMATPESIRSLFAAARARAGPVEVGLHLHVPAAAAEQKVRAAFEAGCRRLDCALGGLGGCPFASDRLVGNLPTERALSALSTLGLECPPAPGALAVPLLMNQEIAHRYGSQKE
jgi:hydroxymethylglutaryl-CoA lyase